MEQIKEFKQKRTEINKAYDTEWELYEEEQAVIRNIEWMTKIKQRLIKDEKWKK
jgi:hypothetical protein